MKKWNPGFFGKFDTNYYDFVANVIPTADGGYVASPSEGATGIADIDTAQVMSSWIFEKIDGTIRFFGCQTTKIYEASASWSSGTWSDVSKGGAAYSAVTNWAACQYGNVTIFVSLANATQASTSGAFADLAGSPPKARHCCVQSNAVVLANYDDGTATPDGVWISDIGDHTTWTPASSNEAAYFRLLQTPGEITALIPFKNKVYAFKKNSFYELEYVGAPIYWTAKVVSSTAGASHESAAVYAGDYIFFGNAAGFYLFDGNSIRQISASYTQSLAYGNSYLKPYDTKTRGIYWNPNTNTVFLYGGGSSEYPICYNISSDMWGSWLPGVGRACSITKGDAFAAINACISNAKAPAMLYFRQQTTGVPHSYPSILNAEHSGITYALAGQKPRFRTAIHADFSRTKTFKRLTPVMTYYATNNSVIGGSITAYASMNPNTGTLSGQNPTIASQNPVRFDFLVTGKLFQADFYLSYDSGTTGYAPFVVYDYVLESVDAGGE